MEVRSGNCNHVKLNEWVKLLDWCKWWLFSMSCGKDSFKAVDSALQWIRFQFCWFCPVSSGIWRMLQEGEKIFVCCFLALSLSIRIWRLSQGRVKRSACWFDALIVYLVGQKELYIVLVDFVWFTRKKCVNWTENGLMCMRKRFTHGVRHWKSEEQTCHHKSFNAWNRNRKKDWWIRRTLHRHFWAIPQRRKMPWHAGKVLGWNEVKCKEMDDSVEEGHSYKTMKELDRYGSKWVIHLNDSTDRWLLEMITKPHSHWKSSAHTTRR